MVFALARSASVDQFGTVVLLVAAVSAWIGFNRGALGTPLLLTSNLERSWITAEAGYATSWAVYSGGLAAAIFATTGALLGDLYVGAAFAISMPFVLAQDVLRFGSIAIGKPIAAVASDGCWTAWMVLIFACTFFGFRPPPAATICLWGLGAAVSAVVIAVPLRIRPLVARIGEWWRTYARARLRFGSLYTLTQVGALLVTLASTVLIGSAAAAAVRGAAALFGPIAMLVSALPLVFIPHARRGVGTVRTQWRVLKTTSTVTSVVTLIAAICLSATPPALGSLVLGPTWYEASRLIPFIGIECAAMCWMVSVYSLFQARGASRTVFGLNIMQFVTQLAFCIAAAYFFETAYSVGIALALSGIISTSIGIVLVKMRRLDMARLDDSSVVHRIEAEVNS
jgi:O-antigen/teichoic acid export membrane protein